MNFHGHQGTDELPDGDYVRYIRSLVGDPPEDVEQAARELARRIGDRRPAIESADPDPVAPAAPAGARVPAPVPTPATVARHGPTLRQAFSRVLVVIGVVLAGLGLVAPDAVSMMPGVILLFAGLAIGRGDARAARRPSQGRT